MLETIRSFKGEERYRKTVRAGENIAQRVARYMINEQTRRPDGTYQRRDDTMWIDDVYMSVPFLFDGICS